MVGQHIVRAAYPASGGNVLPFRQQKLGVGYPAVTRKAGDEPAVICFLRVGYIVNDATDRLAFGAAFGVIASPVEISIFSGVTTPSKTVAMLTRIPGYSDSSMISEMLFTWNSMPLS